jgi:hypothetical protein
VIFKIEAYEVLSNVLGVHWALGCVGDLINTGFLVVKVNAGIEAMCLPPVLFYGFSGAYEETPFTKKIHGNGRMWTEWRSSAL